MTNNLKALLLALTLAVFPQTVSALEVTDLMQLLRNGIQEQVIVNLVQQNPLARPLGPNDVLMLQASGAGAELLEYLTRPDTPQAPAAPVYATAPAQYQQQPQQPMPYPADYPPQGFTDTDPGLAGGYPQLGIGNGPVVSETLCESDCYAGNLYGNDYQIGYAQPQQLAIGDPVGCETPVYMDMPAYYDTAPEYILNTSTLAYAMPNYSYYETPYYPGYYETLPYYGGYTYYDAYGRYYSSDWLYRNRGNRYPWRNDRGWNYNGWRNNHLGWNQNNRWWDNNRNWSNNWLRGNDRRRDMPRNLDLTRILDTKGGWNRPRNRNDNRMGNNRNWDNSRPRSPDNRTRFAAGVNRPNANLGSPIQESARRDAMFGSRLSAGSLRPGATATREQARNQFAPNRYRENQAGRTGGTNAPSATFRPTERFGRTAGNAVQPRTAAPTQPVQRQALTLSGQAQGPVATPLAIPQRQRNTTLATAPQRQTVNPTATAQRQRLTRPTAPERQTVTQAVAPQRPTVNRVAAPQRQTINQAAAPQRQTVNRIAAPQRQTVTQAAAPQRPTVNRVAAPERQTITQAVAPQRPSVPSVNLRQPQMASAPRAVPTARPTQANRPVQANRQIQGGASNQVGRPNRAQQVNAPAVRQTPQVQPGKTRTAPKNQVVNNPEVAQAKADGQPQQDFNRRPGGRAR